MSIVFTDDWLRFLFVALMVAAVVIVLVIEWRRELHHDRRRPFDWRNDAPEFDHPKETHVRRWPHV